jgi:hypothetical protein
METNIRNIEIRILRILIKKGMDISDILSLDILKNDMYIREGELIKCKEKLFDEVDNSYRLNSVTLAKFKTYLKKHKEVNVEEISRLKEEYITYFESMSIDFTDSEKDTAMTFIYKLHWYYLPIYSDMMVNNRGVSPEENLEKYYNSYYVLQDMYKICKGKEEEWKSYKGDINLNKELVFKVYTNRWNKYDDYKVKRTTEGWLVISFAVCGSGDKKGDKSFIRCFEQDNVAYPRVFKYILSRLWELADSTSMNVEELQEKLNDAANLVSAVEKTVSEYTPNWYR